MHVMEAERILCVPFLSHLCIPFHSNQVKFKGKTIWYVAVMRIRGLLR